MKLHTPDWSNLVALDFETYFDQDYSLRRMSTSDYVRDPRFKAQIVGIRHGRTKTKVYGEKNIARALRAIPWSISSLLCHNTAFDGLILSHHYGIVPKHYYDTLSMARGLLSNEIGAGLDEVASYYGLGNKIPNVLDLTKGVIDWPKDLVTAAGNYCAQDVNLMVGIFEIMLKEYPESEIRLIHSIIRMFCDPVLRVDIPRVEKELQRELAARRTAMLGVMTTKDAELWLNDDPAILKGAERQLDGEERQLLITRRVIGSNERFATILRGHGIEPPVKISPAWMKKPKDERAEDGKWAYAFAKDDLEFVTLPEKILTAPHEFGLDPDDLADVTRIDELSERVQSLVECRIAVKSTSNITRAQRFLDAGRDGMRLPVGYAYSRAHTHRLGGNNKMNMQNLTRGGELRKSILAAPGHVICVGDSGQIEARVNGWLWDQMDLLDDFRAGDAGRDRDVYCKFADGVYGRPITKEDGTERFVGKVCVLGLGYAMGANKLQMTLAKGSMGKKVALPLTMVQGMVQLYRARNHRIVSGWKFCEGIIEDMAAGRDGQYKCISWEANTIWLPNGMRLNYPDLKKSVDDNGWDSWSYRSGAMRKKIYGGLLCENLVQALARIIVMDQLLAIDARYRVVMTTHDEIVAHPPKASANACWRLFQRVMTTPPPWAQDLPLAMEGGYAENYSK